MNEREFDQWWKAHRAAFLRIDQWLGKMPTDGERRLGSSVRLSRSEIPDTEITQGDVLRNWRACLADVALKDALDVSTAMSRGDMDVPDNWDAHARYVRKHARKGFDANKKHRGRLIDGEWTYECPLCLDTGSRDIWHSKSVALARKDPDRFLAHAAPIRAEAACTCEAGDALVQRYALRKPPWRIPVFDKACMFEYRNDPERKQNLVDAIFSNIGTEWDADSFDYPGANDDFT